MDLSVLLRMQGLWRSFSARHPKFVRFLQAARGCAQVGTVVEISITRPDGSRLTGNLKLNEADLRALQELKLAAPRGEVQS